MAASQSKYGNKLQGQGVLVIGGTSGIGFCVAEAALENGARVTISSSKPAKVEAALVRLRTTYQEHASRVQGHTCDLSDANLERNLEHVLIEATKAGPLNHICLTAGDTLDFIPISDITMEYVQKVSQVRFMGAVILAKLAPKFLEPAHTNSIILTGGSLGNKPKGAGGSVVAGFCSAMEGLTRGLAKELQPLRVNVVCPGAVHTEMFAHIPPEVLKQLLAVSQDMTTIKQVGKPEDVAEAYLYLMRDNYACGSVLETNGGTFLT